MKTKNTTFKKAATLSLLALLTQASTAAIFTYRIDNAAGSDGIDNDGQDFQQIWGSPTNWNLTSGTDDGANGYPDATDRIIVDRTGSTGNSTRLTTESSPGSLTSIAGITGTATDGAEDILFKSRDFTIGDITVIATAGQSFQIRAERDRSITINGILAGAGDLLLTRSGGFSDGVTPDEVISLTGTSPNTITGAVTLQNTNGTESAYFVGDKIGAFGQTSVLSLLGAGDGITELLLTANTIGGEGAIDDDATSVILGVKGIFNVEAGVNEVIGSGKLDVNGNLIADGVYTSAESWISGAGSITVGAAAIPEPSSTALLGLGGLALLLRRRK